ncbi:Fe-S cluster assembly protein NifU [bacterium]|nr:Fe-S cluster assembly protein NifU [bacterium]
MWDYSEEVMEHYRNPKNVGKIDNADAIGEAGSLVCGDALKLYLKINDDGIIEDAKFQTFGCGSAVASSSMLTEMIIGKSLDEVKKITNKDIADKLGGLPPEKMHCSVMGHEALEDALKKYFNEEITIPVYTKMVCTCFNVSEDLIKEAIETNNLKTVEEITNYTKAGGACGRCKDKIQAILNSYTSGKVEEKAPVKKELTATQKILKINSIIENQISTELRKDGGDIELIDIDGNKVYVKLQGSCSGCKNSTLTIKNFVETTLKEHVCADIEVVEVNK